MQPPIAEADPLSGREQQRTDHGAEGHRALGAVLVLLAAALWATFGLFAKLLYTRGFTPLELASVRATVGFLGAALWLLPRWRRLRIRSRDLLFFAAYGALGFALFETVFFAALARTSIAIAAALLYTAPAFVLLASRVLWHERVPGWKVGALVLVLAGVLLVTGALAAISSGRGDIAPAALALGLGAGAGYALYTLFSKVSTARYGGPVSLFWSFLFAALALGILQSPFEPLFRRSDALLPLLALGILPTLIPYALYLAGLHHLRASTAAMLASVEPAIAALLALLVLAEPLDGTRLLGIALIVGAAVLIAWEKEGTESGR